MKHGHSTMVSKFHIDSLLLSRGDWCDSGESMQERCMDRGTLVIIMIIMSS